MFTIDSTVNPAVVSAVESAYNRGLRVRVWYGDVSTGVAWPEEHDVTGKIGRSTGTNKIPLLINNARSFGGGALLIGSIVRIDCISTGRKLYKHETFSSGEWKAEGNSAYHNGELHAVLKSEKAAVNFCLFMIGSRYRK